MKLGQREWMNNFLVFIQSRCLGEKLLTVGVLELVSGQLLAMDLSCGLETRHIHEISWI